MLIEAIENTVRASAYQTGLDALDPQVLQAVETTDRKLFVHDDLEQVAYFNRPLPIGADQTISQPFIVALMTHLMQPKRTDRVLEIGTGSGWQAAVLANLVEQVYTIEIIPSLAASATKRLADLGYDNVEVITGDGFFGYAEGAPYDSIIVTAQAEHIPPRLLDQLKVGGIMVLPLGLEHGAQTLTVVRKVDQENIEQEPVLSVVFVPMTGQIHD